MEWRHVLPGSNMHAFAPALLRQPKHQTFLEVWVPASAMLSVALFMQLYSAAIRRHWGRTLGGQWEWEGSQGWNQYACCSAVHNPLWHALCMHVNARL